MYRSIPDDIKTKLKDHEIWVGSAGAEGRRLQLIDADLSFLNLGNAQLSQADLTGCDLRRSNVSGAYMRGAVLIDARGLFGPDRAYAESVHDAGWVIYSRPLDKAHWGHLRAIGTLRLFGASYGAFILITLYAFSVRWLNGKVSLWHEWAGHHSEGVNRVWANLLLRITEFPVPQHLGLQLIALGLLAIGSTLYIFRCPDCVKEYTETRWDRELGKPLIEYRSAMYSQIVLRYACTVCYLIGGLYTLGYLLLRGLGAIRFLIWG